MRMNGELERRAVEIIEGDAAPNSEKLTLLLGIGLDTRKIVRDHEPRIMALEAYPVTIKRVAKFLVGLGALAAAIVAIEALAG